MKALNVLGIFPSLGYFDGIGRSGVAAWRGVTESLAVSPVLVSYGTSVPPADTVGEIRHSMSQWAAAWHVLRLSRRFHVTLVWHVHLLRLLPFVRRPGKVAVYLHGIEVYRKLSPEVAKHLHRVDLVLSNSDFTWHRFLEFNPEFETLPHHTVALGLDAPLEEPTPVPAPIPSAVMVGRIARSEAYKGHREVVAAWPEVRRRVPGAELHVVGPGDLYDELRDIAQQNNVAEACHFHGTVTQLRKEELLRNCRCMALPSRGEGFGLAYLESMRLGRPCLVSRSDAGREVVNPPEAGLACDPANTDELVEAVSALLTPGPAWAMLSNQSRARYEALYTEAAFASRLNTALRSLA